MTGTVMAGMAPMAGPVERVTTTASATGGGAGTRWRDRRPVLADPARPQPTSWDGKGTTAELCTILGSPPLAVEEGQ
ncbi:hypothetical protein CHIBA101_1009 [Actinomyces sp. Chiba101]|nr:hypothetical protein CHIBA101_1009 [Actinomyces sp. Chiba101]GAV94148.1 hypothetical protein ADENT20671_0916 [Actinomyces denticolens]